MGKREYEIVVRESHIKMNKLKKKLKDIGGKLVQKNYILLYSIYPSFKKKLLYSY